MKYFHASHLHYIYKCCIFQLQLDLQDLNDKKRKQSKVEVPGIQARVWEDGATVDGRSLIRDLEKYFHHLLFLPSYILVAQEGHLQIHNLQFWRHS